MVVAAVRGKTKGVEDARRRSNLKREKGNDEILKYCGRVAQWSEPLLIRDVWKMNNLCGKLTELFLLEDTIMQQYKIIQIQIATDMYTITE